MTCKFCQADNSSITNSHHFPHRIANLSPFFPNQITLTPAMCEAQSARNCVSHTQLRRWISAQQGVEQRWRWDGFLDRISLKKRKNNLYIYMELLTVNIYIIYKILETTCFGWTIHIESSFKYLPTYVFRLCVLYKVMPPQVIFVGL